MSNGIVAFRRERVNASPLRSARKAALLAEIRGAECIVLDSRELRWLSRKLGVSRALVEALVDELAADGAITVGAVGGHIVVRAAESAEVAS